MVQSLQQIARRNALPDMQFPMNVENKVNLVVIRHPFRVWKSQLAKLLGYSNTYKMKNEFIEPVIFPLLGWNNKIYKKKHYLTREHTRALFKLLVLRGDISQDAIDNWAKNIRSVKLYASSTISIPSPDAEEVVLVK